MNTTNIFNNNEDRFLYQEDKTPLCAYCENECDESDLVGTDGEKNIYWCGCKKQEEDDSQNEEPSSEELKSLILNTLTEYGYPITVTYISYDMPDGIETETILNLLNELECANLVIKDIEEDRWEIVENPATTKESIQTLPQEKEEKANYIKLNARTIYVMGQEIGFQFNRYSNGSRRMERTVHLKNEQDEYGTCTILGRMVQVKRICGSVYHWKTVRVLQ